MELISIIIPVYNTGQYLVKCIDSLINQTYKYIEIIIIDDGSETETANLCDELALKDNRIKTFHKKNAGVSVARNYGIDKAQGKYLGFVDSDDWVDDTMYQRLYEKAIENNADIVYCDALTVWDDGRTENDTWDCFDFSINIEKERLSPGALRLMAGSAWRGLFKTSTGKDIRFPEGLKFSEDRFYNLQWIACSHNIYYIKKPFYFRYMRNGSCVNSYHPDATSTIRVASELINKFVKNHYSPEFLAEFEQQPLGLTLQSFYGVFASNLSFCNKYKEIRKIASDTYLLSVVQKYKPADLRLKLMHYHLICPLFILLWVHNFIKIIKLKNI